LSPAKQKEYSVRSVEETWSLSLTQDI
jgi:hypothetical protein